MIKSPIAAWRQFNAHYRLEATRCTICQKISLPAVKYCPCGSTNFESYHIAPKGSLKSFTQVTTPPAEFKHMAPYCIGLIQLDEGPKIVVQLTDVSLDQLKLNMPMRGVLRKMFAHDTGIIHYGVKFVPENK